MLDYQWPTFTSVLASSCRISPSVKKNNTTVSEKNNQCDLNFHFDKFVFSMCNILKRILEYYSE